MVQSLPWWRKLGAVLAALVLGLLTFGPSLDSIVCHDEAGMSAAASELPTAAEASDQGGGWPSDDALGACVHGHCHHGASYVPAMAAAAASGQEPMTDNHPLPRDRVRTSDPKFGLMRPPRA